MRMGTLLVAGLCACFTGQPLAQQAESTFKLSGYAKLMFVADDKKGGRVNQSTPGFGGRLGVETGEFHGFTLLAAAYTTSDLGLRHTDTRRTDAYMFDLDKKPYSLLGEAQINYRAGKTTITAGRQEFFSPIINSYEYRIIPNLFEAVTLKNRDIADTTLTLAYVSKMSGLDGLVSYSEFRSMSQQTYTSLQVAADGTPDANNGKTLDPSTVVGHHGVWVAGLVHEKDYRLQLWNFHGVDTMNTLYVDGRWPKVLANEITATLEGQAYRVTETGRFKDYLARQGLNASYGLIGFKGTLAHRPSGVSVGLAGNKFSGNRSTVTAFGNWGGYPEFVSMPYLYSENQGISAIAQSRLMRMTLLLNLSRFGLTDQSLLFGHAKINLDESILANSDIQVDTLLYRAKLGSKWSLRTATEWRSSGNSRYDNKFIAVSARYDF
jgi:hypothetical protein